ncbi:carbohydrate porin [Hyphomicrobium sp.]|uniref:carbohydrate porin n=1 Tax=Hyphomicrobium sp. TaxID=82 RepID=UPI002D76B713|nr:carbohydrate porin [Hyphomicrobium sp.]HET6390974.1 carbohydrate porin [Hyphomicrobium sp.]
MKWGYAAGMAPALVLAFLAAAVGARAEEKDENKGLPEVSIARELPYDAARASLAAAGITYGVNYTGEYFNVFSGGLSRGSTYDGVIEGVVDIDLEKVLGWKGAVIHANAFYIHGIGPTTKTGSIFAVSNLEGLEALRLDELWLEQSLFNDKLKVKVGSIAADTEFFISDTAAVFINGTFGWPGITASDMLAGGPGYPLASMGVRVEYAPTDKLTLLAAVFNGSPADPFSDDPQKANRHGVDFRFGDGELVMAEAQYKYELGKLAGTVKLGGWTQLDAPDGTYVNFATGRPVNSDYGIYGIIDQQVWKQGDNQSINVFGRFSGSPGDRSPMDFYFDTGILFAGLVPGRKKDSFGAAFGFGQISSDLTATDPGEIGTHESVLEVLYSAELKPGMTLIPDFQYFWDPGATPEVNHAAVAGARLRINY